MWSEFCRAIVVAVLLLYIPGYLFFRGLRFSPVVAACCAPLFSVFAYAVLPILYYELGIPCSVLSVVTPTALAAIAIYAISCWRETPNSTILQPSNQKPIHFGSITIPFDLAAIAAYVFFAAAVTFIIFVSNLPHADAFYSRFDNQTHINAVQAFVDSGKWSSLHESTSLASPVNQTPYSSNTGGFYPCAWHDCNALVYLASNTNVTISANVVVTVLCALTLPLGTYLMIRAIFPDDRRIVLWGAPAASAFATWPWVYIIKGPCYPNLLGLALMVAALGAVMLYVDNGLVFKKLPSFVVSSVIFLVALALAHPNTLFTAYVFMVAYGAHVINRAITNTQRITGLWKVFLRILCLSAFAAAVVGFWVFCYHVPQLSGVLGYHWSENAGIVKAMLELFKLRFDIAKVQPVMCLVVAAGLVACWRDRNAWLVFVPAFFASCYVICKIGLETLKYWLAALWYMTPYRFTANTCIFLIPIAAMGLDLVYGLARKRLTGSDVAAPAGAHARKERPASSALTVAFACLMVIAVYGAGFFPTFTVPIGEGKQVEAPFQRIGHKINNIYSDDVEHVYGVKEVAFVEKVKEVVPEGALVLNSPNDGSMWAYGVNELNVYYRNRNTAGQTEDATIIRKHLDEYATNKDVQNAVKETNAEYLLLLDKGVSYEDGVWLPQYKEPHEKEWAGINGVDDDTPGFEIVLADGDEMRLYKIEK